MPHPGRVLLASLAAIFQAVTLWAQPVFPPVDPAACVAKPQRLLILDGKSGWWSGDGGELHKLLLERLVKDCPQIDVEYYYLQHIDPTTFPPDAPLPPGLKLGLGGIRSFYPPRAGVSNDSFWDEANFPTRPWNDYNQVWLLSGDDEDETDVPTTHSFFRDLLTKFTTPASSPAQPGPNYFLGTGIAHHSQANKVLAAFQMPELFQTHLDQIDNPNVTDDSGVEVMSRSRVGAELTAHALFEGVESVADRLSLNGVEYESDFMLLANNPFQIIGQNTHGEPSIGVRDTPTKRWVVDTGMQRFYTLHSPTETNTYRYLLNTIKFLAR